VRKFVCPISIKGNIEIHNLYKYLNVVDNIKIRRLRWATSEDELQTMAHQLNRIARKYKMTISSTKTKSMAMCGNYYRGSKL